MMNKLIKYIVGSLVVFLLLLAWQGWQLKNKLDVARVEIQRLKDNQAQLLAENQRQSNLILNQNEVTGKIKAERDSLAKVLGIRPKQIVKYVDRVVVEHRVDTVPVMVTPYNDVSWHLTDTTKCMLWEADALLDGSILS